MEGNRNLYVLRQTLYSGGPVVRIPFQLELTTLRTVEQSVIAVALDELLYVLSIILFQDVVGHGHIEVLTVGVGLLAACYDVRKLRCGGALAVNQIELRSNQHYLTQIHCLCVQRKVILRLHGDGGNDAGSAVGCLVSSVGECQVHISCSVLIYLVYCQVLHLGDVEVCSGVHILEYSRIVIQNLSKCVQVLYIICVYIYGKGLACLHVCCAGQQNDVAGYLTSLLSTAIQVEHGECVIPYIVVAIAVNIAESLLNLLHEGLSVLLGEAEVVLHVGVVAVCDGSQVIGTSYCKAVGAVLLIDGQLVAGEEVALGLCDNNLYITSRACQRDLFHVLCNACLCIIGPIRVFRTDPLGGPVHTIQAGLYVHLLYCAVAVVVMSCIILQLIQRVGLTVIEDHRDGVCYNVAGGVEHACCLADIMVGQVSQLAPGISACPGDFFRRRYVSPGIQRSGCGYFLRPFRVAVLISCAYLISMCRVVLQIGVRELGCVACSVDDAVYQNFVAGCALYSIPGQGVAGRGLSGHVIGQVSRSSQIRVQLILAHVAVVLKAFQNQGLCICLRIGVGELHIQLRRRRLILHHCRELILCLYAVVLDSRGLVIVISEGACCHIRVQNLILAVHRYLSQLCGTVLCCDSSRLFGNIDYEGSVLIFIIPCIASACLLSSQGCHVAFYLGSKLLRYMFAIGYVSYSSVTIHLGGLVLCGDSVILIHGVLGGSCRPELYAAVCLVDLGRAVVLLPHGDDGTILYKDRKLPDGSVEVVQGLSAVVLLAGEVVDPDLICVRKVDAVSHIISLGVAGCILVNRCYQHVGAEHVLILHILGACVSVTRILQEHSTDHRKSGVAVACIQVCRSCRAGVDVRHQLSFQLQVHSVDTGVRIAEGLRSLRVASPAVHVQHQRREYLPLGITGGYNLVSAEDTVHITTDIRVTA